jgi:hypothetical protein
MTPRQIMPEPGARAGRDPAGRRRTVGRRIAVAIGPWLPVIAVGAFVAYYQVFTSFARYDDEGYLLVSLAEFVRGGTLYEGVYTQYGPFYYLLFGSLFDLLGHPVTTDAGRLIVICVWLATATLHGIAAHRLTGRLGIAIAAQIVAVMTLRLLVAEPMHPVGLTTLLVAAMLALARPSTTGPVRTAVGLGLLVAMLAMTKVNTGALAGIAVVVAAGLCLPPLRDRSAVRIAVLVLLTVTPVVLLVPDLDRGWVRELLIVVLGALAAVAVTVIARVRGAGDGGASGMRWLAVFVGAAVAGVSVIVLVTLAMGTSARHLVEGVVVEPARLREVFVLPLPLPDLASYAAVAAVALAAVAGLVPRAREALPAPVPAVLRVGLALAIWAAITLSWPLQDARDSARLALPLLFAWIAAVPPRGVTEGPTMAFARVFSVLLAILMVLQAYPVAGTQQAAAALTFVPVGALLLVDGVRGLEMWVRLGRSAFAGQAPLVGIVVVAVIVARFAYVGLLVPLRDVERTYLDRRSLGVHGADRVRLPTRDATEYRRLVGAIRTNCDTFISIPGLNSFYIWSDIRPPTGMNTGDWMFLLDEREQQRVVDAVRGVSRLCLVRSNTQLLLWVLPGGKGAVPNRPLTRFISRTQFRKLDSALGGFYDLLIRPRAPDRANR